MCAMMNGIALHGGFIPYGGTFLVFSDYARNALRMAALMKHPRDLRVHARLDRARRGRPHAPAGGTCGEPATHTQYGRLAALRHGGVGGRLGGGASRGARGRLPCCCRARTCPTCSSDSLEQHRQGRLRALRCRRGPRGHHRHRLRSVARPGCAEAARRGGRAGARGLDALDQRVRPAGRGISRTRFCRCGVPRVAVEAGVTDYWRKYVGLEGAVVGIDRFGESAPGGRAVQAFRLYAGERRKSASGASY